jgi:CHASE3 domain sensor protein
MPPVKSKPLAALYWSVLAAVCLAALAVIGVFLLGARTQSENEWVRHTMSVRNHVAEVIILVQRVETSQRGYLLTGRESYLAPFTGAMAALPPAIDQVASLVTDNPNQQHAVGRLRQLTSEKLRELRSTIDEMRAGRSDAALAIVNNDSGLRFMEQIRNLVDDIQREEDRLLAERQSRSADFFRLLQSFSLVAFFFWRRRRCSVSVWLGAPSPSWPPRTSSCFRAIRN